MLASMRVYITFFLGERLEKLLCRRAADETQERHVCHQAILPGQKKTCTRTLRPLSDVPEAVVIESIKANNWKNRGVRQSVG